MNLFTNLHNPITRHKLYNYIFTTYNIIYTSIEAYSFETKLRYSVLSVVYLVSQPYLNIIVLDLILV